jgi:hypothetical protein
MAMIISVLSTLTVINAYESAKMPAASPQAPAQTQDNHLGTVSFSVVSPGEKKAATASGTVSFSIIKGDNQ